MHFIVILYLPFTLKNLVYTGCKCLQLRFYMLLYFGQISFWRKKYHVHLKVCFKTINHHKLLNLNLKFLLLLMQCQYAKSRWVKNGKIVQYNFKNKYLNGKKIFQRNSSQNCTFLDYIAHCEYYCCYGGR